MIAKDIKDIIIVTIFQYTDTPITQITSFLTGDVLMSADFLTCEQKARYGKFTEELGSDQLAKYFWLDDQDPMC